MLAKPLAANKTKRRKRNKSSPANQRFNKKHKSYTDSDSEDRASTSYSVSWNAIYYINLHMMCVYKMFSLYEQNFESDGTCPEIIENITTSPQYLRRHI